MRRRSIIQLILTIIFSVGAAHSVHAAGMIARVQQMKARRQGPTQEDYNAYLLQQQQANQQQAQQAPPPTYQQTVDQRNQAIAQAIRNAHHQDVSTESVPFGNQGDERASQQPTLVPAMVQTQTSPADNASSDVKDVVDLAEVWKKLDTRSTVWQILIDDQSKVLTVSEYIGRYQKMGVKITAPPEHYVQMIDQASAQNPAMLNRPFGELLEMLAIIDYDFDNGTDKDELAKKVLGEAGYEMNKKRFTQQLQAPPAQPSP